MQQDVAGTPRTTGAGDLNDLPQQMVYILQHTIVGSGAVGAREKQYFQNLHAAFVSTHPDLSEEHDVVTWANQYEGQLQVLKNIRDCIKEWCSVQQPCQLCRAIPSPAAASQHQLQHAQQASSLMLSLLVDVHAQHLACCGCL